MTSNSNTLLDRVLEFVASGGDADERTDSLLLRGAFTDVAMQSSWLTLVSDAHEADFVVQIYNPAIGGDLNASDAFDPACIVNITINKPSVEGCSCFFLEDQLGRYWQESAIVPGLLVADLAAQSVFVTRGVTVKTWDVSLPLTPYSVATRIDPTPYVRDFVPVREVPADLSPWILVTPPALPTAAFLRWRAIASRRLLASLVTSAWLEDDAVWLQASGPPLYRLKADDPAIETAFESLSHATTWVFLSGADVEARHIIFASELARANRVGQTFAEMVTRALDSAKASYEAHVQSSSRETLKALGELRKMVIDETQKVTQKTQDLTAALWRDLAVTAAPFALKILGDAGKVTTPAIAAGFYFGAATFVALSLVLQWRINAAYFKSQTASRTTWLRTLYNYISTQERNEIADAPITDAMTNYCETRTILLMIYVVLVALLIGFGIFTLQQGSGTASPMPKTIATPVASSKSQSLSQTPKTPVCVPSAKAPCPPGIQ
jgi:hypothetical protein